MKSTVVIKAVLSFGLFCLGVLVYGQNCRLTYTYWKQRTVDNKYNVSRDLLLDIHDGRGAFYCERSFCFDSLMSCAFGREGDVIDKQARDKLNKAKKGNTEWTYIDYKSNEYIQYYNLGSYLVSGAGILEMPAWEHVEEEKVIDGYLCQKARADYLGRQWTIWYTKEIPLNYGPWLLWGAPGLIIDARDADNLFVFRLTNIMTGGGEERISFMKDYYSGHLGSVYDTLSMSADRADQMYVKYYSDADFFMQLTGGGSAYIIDSDGNKTTIVLPKVIPLIPIEYWKRRQ